MTLLVAMVAVPVLFWALVGRRVTAWLETFRGFRIIGRRDEP